MSEPRIHMFALWLPSGYALTLCRRSSRDGLFWDMDRAEITCRACLRRMATTEAKS